VESWSTLKRLAPRITKAVALSLMSAKP